MAFQSIFPNQKLTEAEKISKYGSIQNWGEFNVNAILRLSGDIGYNNTHPDTVRMQSLYDLAAGLLNPDDFTYVTQPWGMEGYNFPATFTHYDIISPKLNLLKGEEIKRPFNFRVSAVNEDGYNEANEEKMKLLVAFAKQNLAQQLKQEGIDISLPENQQLLTPQGIEDYIRYGYKGTKEVVGQKSLNYLIQNNDILYRFNKGWEHLLISGQEIYWTGIVNGEPKLRIVNPLFFTCDKSTESLFVDESAWAREIRYISASEVHDEFHEFLKPEDVEKIEEMKGHLGQLLTSDGTMKVPTIYNSGDVDTGHNYFSHNSQVFIKVCHVEWVSLRKIGILTYIDQFGEQQETIVDEKYKIDKSKDESIEWQWCNEVWEGVKIGTDIYLNIRPKPNQYKNMNNPSSHRLGYTGIIYNNLNSKPYSLVEIMRPHQFLYDVILYRLELEIAKAQGKKMLMDISQIPRSQGFDVEKWIYYFSIMGIAFVNPHEEGKGKLGEGKTSSFNQFQAVDLSLARIIDQYIMILNKLEDMIGEISGVSRQRQGEINTSELVGNVETAKIQSSHITEPLFYIHNEVKRRVLTQMIEDAKLAWIDGKKIHYIMDDLAREFFEIDGDLFINSDYGVFVSNSAKDQEILNTIKQLAQAALQNNKAELVDILKIMKSESIEEAEVQLEEAYERSSQQEQQSAQQQYQAEAEEKQKDREMQQYKIDKESETKITVAQIMSFVNQKNQDIDNNGIPDQLEIAKLLAKERESERKEGIENKKIDVEREQIKSNEKIKEKEIEVKKQANSIKKNSK